MKITDTATGKSLILRVQGYQFYERYACYDRNRWLDVCFCFDDPAHGIHAEGVDACMEYSDLERFARLFEGAAYETERGFCGMHVPIEQMPFIAIRYLGNRVWRVQVDITLPNGGPDTQFYSITARRVSDKSLLLVAKEFRYVARALRTQQTVPGAVSPAELARRAALRPAAAKAQSTGFQSR